MSGRDEAGPADGGDENVRSTTVRREIVRLTVTNCHGRIFVQQEHGHRLADDVAAAEQRRRFARDGQRRCA